MDKLSKLSVIAYSSTPHRQRIFITRKEYNTDKNNILE